MKKIWEAIKRFFGWKPKVVPVPVNNFNDWSLDERAIATLININREESNAPDLTPNQLLWRESIKRCETQFYKDKVSHDGVGVAFTAITGEGYTSPAEILAYAYSSPESVTKAWLKSDSHKKIILKPSYKYFGVAQRTYNDKKYYCVLFCK